MHTSREVAPAPGQGLVTPTQAKAQIHKMMTGIPTPAEIERQKAAYSQGLDAQMKMQEELLKLEQVQQANWIKQEAENRKRQACLAIEQEAKQQEILMHQHLSGQWMGLQSELQNMRMVLERQAGGLQLEYEQRKHVEEQMLAQVDAQTQAFMTHQRFAQQIQQNQSKGGLQQL
jgi:hypothetical protein